MYFTQYIIIPINFLPSIDRVVEIASVVELTLPVYATVAITLSGTYVVEVASVEL